MAADDHSKKGRSYLVFTSFIARALTNERGSHNIGSTLLVLTLAMLFWITGSNVEGTTLGPLSPQDVLNTRELAQLIPIDFSPDGKLVAYTVQNTRKARPFDLEAWASTGVPQWAAGADIWISSVKGSHRNLTQSKGDNWHPTWSPDGHYLAFFSNRDGSGQARLWIWNALTNKLRRVSKLDIRGDQIEWTRDGKQILIPVLPQQLSIEEYVSARLYGRVPQNPGFAQVPGSTVVLYTANALTRSDAWNLDDNLRDVALVNILNGETTFIVRGHRVSTYLLAPDGAYLAYTSPRRFEKPGAQQILFDLITVELSTGKQRVFAKDIRLAYDGAQFAWSPTGEQLAYRSSGTTTIRNDIYVIDLKSGKQLTVARLQPTEPPDGIHGTLLWNDTGTDLYFIHDGALWRTPCDQARALEIANIPNRRMERIISRSNGTLWSPPRERSATVLAYDEAGKRDGFYRIDLRTFQAKKLLERDECYTCINIPQQVAAASREELAYFAEDSRHDADIWIADEKFKVYRLTDLNPQFEKHELGGSRLISWLSDDGTCLHGALLLPAGYEKGKRYPLVTYVYGGASLSDTLNRFGAISSGSLNMQLLVTRGIAVLLPDAPQHLGTPMADLAKTVLPGINKVIEMGIADPHRLGVMGQSYGGYSTLALMVQTKRFTAAVEVDGFGNLAGMYGEADKSGAAFGTTIMESGQGLMGGTPWQYPERYVENSPTSYLNRIQTPLLIIHGASDSDVAPFLGDEIFVGLRRLQKPVEYAKYLGEEHSPLYWSYANQLDFCNRWVSWFTKYLRP